MKHAIATLRTRLPALIVTAFVAATVIVVILVASSSGPGGGSSAVAATRGFAPKQLAGKWEGTWTNKTFGSTGSIRANIKAPKNRKLTGSIDFSGNVFGCNDPGPAVFSFKKGSGANRTNARGFRVDEKSEAFGDLDLTYSHSAKTLKGTGSNPPCAPGLSWQLDGSLTNKALSGTVNINLAGGASATTEISAKKL